MIKADAHTHVCAHTHMHKKKQVNAISDKGSQI